MNAFRLFAISLLTACLAAPCQAQSVIHSKNLNPKIKDKVEKDRSDREKAQKAAAAANARPDFKTRIAGVKDTRSPDHPGGTPKPTTKPTAKPTVKPAPATKKTP